MKRALFAAFAVCAVLVPSAGAAPRISALDTSSFPELRVTIVAPLGAKAPTLRENGKPVAALSAVNLGRTKSIMLALDRSQSMRGRPLANAIAAAQSFTGAVGAEDHVGVVAFGHTAVALTAQLLQPGRGTRPARGHDRRQQGRHRAVRRDRRRRRPSRPGRPAGPRDRRRHRRRRRLEPAFVQRCRARGAQGERRDLRDRHRRPGLDARHAARSLQPETGGSYRQASISAELAATYAGLRDELARTWQLSYLTSSPPGSKVTLTAAVAGAHPRFDATLAFSRRYRGRRDRA